MAKKFVPDPELLNTILTTYKTEGSYAAVSRATGISSTIIKRIIQEAGENNNNSDKENSPPKPKTTAQILAYHKEYKYNGPPPIETACPKKTIYYGKMVTLKQEFLDV